jgi:hypothetical protein
MSVARASAFARLVALLFLVGLTASRVGVVVHELGGHGAVARGFGCSLTALRLFLFGGGWVDYDCGPLAPAQQLAIDLGGIAVQAIAGALLALVARWVRDPFARLAVAGTAALFVLHALYYLVTGVHYGVGDGRALHVLAARDRGAWVAAGSAALVGLCFVLTRRIAAALTPWIPGEGALRRAAIAAAAMVLAAALHGAGFAVEQRIRAERQYAAAFVPQPEIAAQQELRRFEAERPRSADEIRAERRAIAREHAVFPLRPALAIALPLAAFAGLFAALRSGGPPIARGAPPGALARAALVCAVAQAIVVAIDRAF